MANTYLCTTCFNRHPLHHVAFRCTANPTDCPPTPDEAWGQIHQLAKPPLLNKIIPPTSRRWYHYWHTSPPLAARCPTCQTVSRLRVCPSCHAELPAHLGRYTDCLLAIVGAQNAGKSHYLAVLIDKLRNEVGRAFNLYLQPANDATIERYRHDFYNPLFREQRFLTATSPPRKDRRVKTPLLFTQSLLKPQLLWRQRLTLNLAFFDTAGEELDSEALMRVENKYIYHAGGIILLLDPLQLPVIRAHLAGTMDLPPIETDAEDIIIRVANLIRHAHYLSSKQWIEIPIALVLSKIDRLYPLLDAASPIHYIPQHNGKFDQQDFQQLQVEIETLLYKWRADALLRAIKHHFKYFAFFAVSALGAQPLLDGSIMPLRPQRVEDPYLWLLWQRGWIG